jgi:hypothetical protein
VARARPAPKGDTNFKKLQKRALPEGVVQVEDQPDDAPPLGVVPPGTVYRVDKRSGEFQCLVTVMPNNLSVAWDNCGSCHTHVRICQCRSGVQVERSVEYIYDQITALVNGEEWDHTHRHYRGSLVNAAREARRVAAGPRTFARLTEPPPRKKEPGKRLRPPARLNNNDRPVPEEARDLGALQRAANDAEAGMDARLDAMVSKRLRKNTNKKPLRRRTI